MPALNVEIPPVVAKGETMTTEAFHSSPLHVDRMRYVLATILNCTPQKEGKVLHYNYGSVLSKIKEDLNLAPLLKENIVMNLRPILESLEIFSIKGDSIMVHQETLELEMEAWGLSNP